MSRPTLREVVVRAREIGPTWTELVAIVVVDVAATLWWGVAWWLMALATAVGGVIIFGTLAWLDLENEAADQAAQDPSEAE